MIVSFWGVRGSIPVPGKSTIRYGGNTPCVTIEQDDTLIIIDCGTGLRVLGQKLSAESDGDPINAHILISHTHWDHIQGFPFFKPAFIPKNSFTIYGAKGVNRQIEDTLAGQMESPYFPVALEAMAATLNFEAIDEQTFTIGKLEIETYKLNHPGNALGFRISGVDGSMVYISDHEPFYRLTTTALAGGEDDQEKLDFAKSRDSAYTDFIKGADLLIEDSPYTKDEYTSRAGWGHACIDDVVEIALAGGVTKLALFHHEPMHDDSKMDEIVSYCRNLLQPNDKLDVFAAQEGIQIKLPLSPSP
ncbi:MAG: MBL fold metallo-hydrolase [Gemmatimonadota bacterium]|nr:MBL fold metallo-hydrolase [Gemmatimonadota bacterium]